MLKYDVLIFHMSKHQKHTKKQPFQEEDPTGSVPSARALAELQPRGVRVSQWEVSPVGLILRAALGKGPSGKGPPMGHPLFKALGHPIQRVRSVQNALPFSVFKQKSAIG